MITYFIHVPKTAGTSVKALLKEIYPEDEILLYYPENKFDVEACICELAEILKLRPKTKLVFGHFVWGMHLASPNKDYQYIAVIRNPVSRWISRAVHHFTRNQPGKLLQLGGKKRLIKNLSLNSLNNLTDFLSPNQGPLSSRQFKILFSGSCELNCGSNLIDRYAYIGRQESISEDMKTILELLKIENRDLSFLNIGLADSTEYTGIFNDIEWQQIIEANLDEINFFITHRLYSEKNIYRTNTVVDELREEFIKKVLIKAHNTMSQAFSLLADDRREAQRIIEHLSARQLRSSDSEH